MSGSTIRLARETWADWLRVDAPRLLFVLRTVLAALLALGVSMALELGAPGTAMITVFIVAAPRSGDVIAKGFYRICATFVGAVAAVTLVATLVEQRTLFVIALALWIGCCTAGAAYVRGYRAYGFVLAGYTVGIIALPAIATPEAVFEIAVMRATEVIVGIVSAVIVADILLPEYASHTLRDAVRCAYADVADHAGTLLSGRSQPQQRLARGLALAEAALALELRREAAHFESAEQRRYAPQLRRFADAMSRSDTHLHAWGMALDRLRSARSSNPAVALAGEIAGQFARLLAHDGHSPRTADEAAAIEHRLQVWRDALPERLAALRQLIAADDVEAQLDFDALAERFARLVDSYVDFTGAYVDFVRPEAARPRAATGWLPHTDAVEALLMGLRGFVAILLMASFWIATDWPRGPNALLFTAVLCTLFASLPQPRTAVRDMAISIGSSCVMAVVFKFAVLPHADDYVALALLLSPFLAACAWITVKPATASIGRGIGMFFPVLLNLQPAPAYDLPAVLNDSLSSLGACFMAMVAFAALVPTASGFSRRLRRSLWSYAARCCAGDIERRRHRLDHGVRELLTILVGRNGPKRADQRPRLTACALAVLDAGHATLAAREAAERQGHVTVPLRLWRDLARFYAEPDDDGRRRGIAALADVERTLSDTLAARASETSASPRWHRQAQADAALHAALRQLRLLLADPRWYADLQAQAETAAPALTGAVHGT